MAYGILEISYVERARLEDALADYIDSLNRQLEKHQKEAVFYQENAQRMAMDMAKNMAGDDSEDLSMVLAIIDSMKERRRTTEILLDKVSSVKIDRFREDDES